MTFTVYNFFPEIIEYSNLSPVPFLIRYGSGFRLGAWNMEPLRDFLEQQLLRKEIYPIVFLLRIFPGRLQPLEPLKDEALAPDREPS